QCRFRYLYSTIQYESLFLKRTLAEGKITRQLKNRSLRLVHAKLQGLLDSLSKMVTLDFQQSFLMQYLNIREIVQTLASLDLLLLLLQFPQQDKSGNWA